MKARVQLTGYIDIDVLHPTFVDLLDPTKVGDDFDDRTSMALDGYLSMLVRQALGAGKAVEQWEVAAVESLCRVCSCTDNHACEGGCEWVESDLCSSCVAPAPAQGGLQL